MPSDLPVADTPGSAAERADAARNRERILRVAGELVGARGIEAVSMQEIAKTAGVGAGTVYRRFGDRAGLALALLDVETADLQNAVLRGDPPLGPGAPPLERLKAFGRRFIELVDAHAELMLAADGVPENRNGPTAFWLTHVTVLLREACPDQDAEVLARMLLAAVHPRTVAQARRALGWPLERVTGGWDALIDALA